MTEKEADAAMRLAVHGPAGLAAWFEAFGKIRDKHGNKVSPSLNKLQARVCAAICWCIINKKPIRLAILKPRQKGSSTISVAASYWFMRMFDANGVVIGGQLKDTESMWKILKLYAKEDRYAWDNEGTIDNLKAVYGEGGGLLKETAKNENAARSGTFQVLLATEAARWKGEVADPRAVISGAMNCIPDQEPKTLAILDTTAKGPQGFYYDTWCGAVTLDERKRGLEGNGWLQIFAGWWEFEDSRMPIPEEFENVGAFVDSYDEKEKDLIAKYPIDHTHIAWRRFKIKESCNGDPAEFDMDFPGEPDDAFRASSNRFFPNRGLKILMQEAKAHKMTPSVFDQPNPSVKRYVLRPVGEDENHDVVIFEAPFPGGVYNIAIDTMTGEMSSGGKDTDSHFITVWRGGYYRAGGVWMPRKLAARSAHPCRWDIDKLIDVAERLSIHYGECLVVPEENQDRGLIRELLRRGVHVYRRTSDDEQPDTRKAKPLQKLGFRTQGSGEKARYAILEKFKIAVRDCGIEGSGIEIPCKVVVAEMENFIVNDKGRPEAATGKHDDGVMSSAIGIATEDGGTVFRPKSLIDDLPPDIRNLQEQVLPADLQYS